jgi:DNA-binding SARP family transcriptional activator
LIEQASRNGPEGSPPAALTSATGADDGSLLRVALLGGFAMALGNAPLAPLGTPRLQSLLAYLLLHRDMPQVRQQLAFLFWPDSDEAQSRTNLRNLLHRLHKNIPPIQRFLEVEPGTLRWRPDTRLSVDVIELDLAIATADEAARRGDVAATRASLEAAVGLYRGELLPGLYDDWIVAERERHAGLFVRALGRLVSLLEETREYGCAIQHAERLLRNDPLSESTYRQLMRLHALAGDPVAALRVYATCVEVLRRELGVAPSGATQQMHELVRRGTFESPAPARPAPLRLVGREQEWLRLRRVSETAGPRPKLVVLAGEAGIGKTRLAEELLEWQRRQGHLTAVAHCYLGRMVSYAPIAGWLREPCLQDGLAGLADLWLTEVGRIVPELLIQRSDLPRPAPMRGSWQRLRLFEALAHALVAAARPLTLLLDDLHWCDQATLDWLGFFLRWAAPTQVTLCTTLRAEELNDRSGIRPLLAGLRRDGLVHELELGRLDAAETDALAAQVAGRPLAPAAVEDLYRESEGNPLYVVEAVRVGQRGSQPPTMQAVIVERLAQLSPGARDLVGLAATIGRAFALPLLVRASGRTEDEVVVRLDELTQRRIIRAHDDGSYDFSHDKIRSVAYAGLSTARRHLLHRRVAEALEALDPDLDVESSTLARHYEAAGNLERAAALLQRAGQAASRVYANADAIGLFERAIALLDASAPKAGVKVARAQTVAALHESVGDILLLTGDFARAIAAFQAARPLVAPTDRIRQARLQRKIGNTRDCEHAFGDALAAYELAEAALSVEPLSPSPDWWQEWIAIQLGRFIVFYWTADVEAMNKLTPELGPAVERFGAPMQRVSYLQWLANANHRRERYVPSDETLAYCRAVLQTTLEADRVAGEGDARFIVGFALLWRGALAEAEPELASARALAERNGDITLRMRATIYLATLCRLAGRPEAARQLAVEAMTLAGAGQMPEYVGAALGHLAWVAWRAGDRVAAAEHARAALETWSGISTVYAFFWQARWPLLGLALARGDVAEAIEHASAMLDCQQQRLSQPLTAALDIAVRAWRAGQAAAARARLDDAQALARDIGYL